MNPNLAAIVVVIPTLEEEANLRFVLASLTEQTTPPERVIVVDGGSKDGTREVARAAGAEVILASGVRGRGNQIALGVEGASEPVVLVAHADMRFPPNALCRIREHLCKHPACPGGCLGHRFASLRRVYRMIEWFDRRRAMRGHSYGDQAQFFRRSLLTSTGGFPSQPIMEDVELAARIRKLGQPAYLDCPVIGSPRKFEREGLFRTLLQNWRYRRAYCRGGVAATRAIYEQYYTRRPES